MKKKYLIFFFCLILNSTKFFAQAIFHDPIVNASVITEFLASLDQLYQMYDHTMNQIEMIQQNYERLQFYIDRASSFNFEEIEWDGDLDFRNEIKNATSQMDKQLTNIRKIRDTLNAKTITFGNESFSFKSLCGIKDDHNGNLVDMIKAATNYYGDGFKQVAENFAKGVPEGDAMMLWYRYGLTPANYFMVREVEKNIDKKIEYFIASTEEDLKAQQEGDKEFYETISNIIEMMGMEGATEPELLQVNGMLQEQTIFTLKAMQEDLKQGISYLVWQDILKKQTKESEQQSRYELMSEYEKNSVSDLF
ncbi:MAG: hypothetical protein MJ181_01765 [Treponema sp.]|uniref:hypothetical protein n=1 Tax=Treponema sp. TaxID=166 RepID=UPI00298E1C8F|nr:hypothetical protein [Treponema sp.]MCQ2596549.1 hypothetical protein [Treponema sp.]MCQ2601094.1 hypothetical protein [Treponema sp.]